MRATSIGSTLSVMRITMSAGTLNILPGHTSCSGNKKQGHMTSLTFGVSFLRNTFQKWTMRRCSRVALANLDDHLLKDIGLSRYDALEETTKPFWVK